MERPDPSDDEYFLDLAEQRREREEWQAEWDQEQTWLREQRAAELLDVLVDIARTGGGL